MSFKDCPINQYLDCLRNVYMPGTTVHHIAITKFRVSQHTLLRPTVNQFISYNQIYKCRL